MIPVGSGAGEQLSGELGTVASAGVRGRSGLLINGDHEGQQAVAAPRRSDRSCQDLVMILGLPARQAQELPPPRSNRPSKRGR